MTSESQEFTSQVAAGVIARLPGPLDFEKHRRIEVDSVHRKEPQNDQLLSLDVEYLSDGVRRRLAWPVTAWDEFTDGSVEQTVAAIVSMIRIEIREQVDTREFN